GRDENPGSTEGAERPEMARAERAAKRWPKGPANPFLSAMVIFDSRFSIFDWGTHRFGADGRDENPGGRKTLNAERVTLNVEVKMDWDWRGGFGCCPLELLGKFGRLAFGIYSPTRLRSPAEAMK